LPFFTLFTSEKQFHPFLFSAFLLSPTQDRDP
jgi:hypothetical protein